jgi:hypothetical protein
MEFPFRNQHAWHARTLSSIGFPKPPPGGVPVPVPVSVPVPVPVSVPVPVPVPVPVSVSVPVPVPVRLCNSIVGFAFWTVVGVDACPDLPCCDIVPPQLPLLIVLSLVLELDTGFKHELLIEAA